MNEAQARELLLVRAFETPPAPPWSEADAAWASREALRTLGEQAAPADLLSHRATLAASRLAEREPAIAAARATGGGLPGAAGALLLLALLFGLALDAVGAGQRINILAPPFAALVAWNLAVYALLAVQALRAGTPQPAHEAGPLQRSLTRLAQHRLRRRAKRAGLAALGGFAHDWAEQARPLHAQRVALLLHGAAAMVALGALASLYLRGLAFEYRAGWDSTFLSAEQVHALLSVVLWPALQITGAALPEPAQLAALRFSQGGGENAARWIHLIAVTVALLVLLPRATLAAAAAWRARRLARHFPLQTDTPYFLRLLRRHSGEGLAAQVLPYSYHLPPENLRGLELLLAHALGEGVALRLADALPWGEDEPPTAPATPGEAAPDLLLPLFALSATPQHDTHGAFLRRLLERPNDGSRPRLVLVDESGLRRRYSALDAATRLGQRRAAWQKLLDDLGLSPLFVDLARPDLHAASGPLQQALAASHRERRS